MKLNRCPFCGSYDVVQKQKGGGSGFAFCRQCVAESGAGEEGIDAWDRVSDLVHGATQGETVKRRIAYADHPNGDWCASGWNDAGDAYMMDAAVNGIPEGERRLWIEVDVPVPQPTPTVKGKVTDE